MYAVQGTPVNISGRTIVTPTPWAPGPATVTARRIDVPVPFGRQIGGTPLAPATTFARYVRVRNLEAPGGADLRVAFLDSTYVTVKAGAEEEFSGVVPFFSVQSSAGVVQWEAHAVVAA
jgi:hypothetical protein